MFDQLRSRTFGKNLFNLAFCAVLTTCSSSVFATGNIDLQFGVNGVAKHLLPNTGSGVMDVVMLPDDKMVIGGTGFNSLNTLAFARVDKDGNLDPTFGGGNGYVNYSSPDVPVGVIEGFSIDTHSNIYAVGHGASISNAAYIFKLNNTGALDTGFANNGMYLHSSHPRLSSNDTQIIAAAVQPDNKVVVVGKNQVLNQGSFLLRLLPDGTPDSSFGLMGDGLVFIPQMPIAPSTMLSTNGFSLKVLDTGEIVLGGFVDNTGWGSFVARFTSNGLLDTSFNGSGFNMIVNAGWGGDWAGYIEVDRLGHVYLLSRVTLGGLFDRCLVTKFHKTGQIDTDYGTNGQTWLTPPAGDYYNCGSLVLASHGGLAVAAMGAYPAPGASYNGPAIVLRLDEKGDLDQNFGTQGVTSVWNPQIINSTYAGGLFNNTFVEPQSDGNLVFVIGEYQTGGVGYTIGRLDDHGNSFNAVPNGFSTKDMRPRNSWITSNLIQVQNLHSSVAIVVEIENGEYSINGLPYTSSPGWVRNNDLVNVRHHTGSGSSYVGTATLKLGGDRDRKNAGMIRGERVELDFLVSTGAIALDPADPGPIVVVPGPLSPLK